MRRVVVTGIGMINAVGQNCSESFAAIVRGECGIKKISAFDAHDFSVQIAAEITDFDPTTVMDAKEVKKADRFIQLGLKASYE
ncbi:MAG: beta-ketoacyl-ACP synthase II, partial [Helicobacter sp.]|nr:beta-ketoacyl-ACP synthase II [Helicobacter sp.]